MPRPPALVPAACGARGRRPAPLYLVCNKPHQRLHSHLDYSAVTRAVKIGGREALRIHPDEDAARGIRDGNVVRISNARGSCLAAAVLSEALRPGVLQLATGAWLPGHHEVVMHKPDMRAVLEPFFYLVARINDHRVKLNAPS